MTPSKALALLGVCAVCASKAAATRGPGRLLPGKVAVAVQPETPAPTAAILDVYPVPNAVAAVGYDYYNDIFVGTTGPRSGDGTLGNVIAGEYGQYKIDVAAAGNYAFSISIKGTPPGTVALKLHFRPGASDCSYDKNASYFPTIDIAAWAGSNTFQTYSASNNVMAFKDGAQTVTMCFDDASYLFMDSFTMAASNRAAQAPPAVNTATFFNSAWVTLAIILGGCGAVVVAVAVTWRVCCRKPSEKAAPLPRSPDAARAVPRSPSATLQARTPRTASISHTV